MPFLVTWRANYSVTPHRWRWYYPQFPQLFVDLIMSFKSTTISSEECLIIRLYFVSSVTLRFKNMGYARLHYYPVVHSAKGYDQIPNLIMGRNIHRVICSCSRATNTHLPTYLPIYSVWKSGCYENIYKCDHNRVGRGSNKCDHNRVGRGA